MDNILNFSMFPSTFAGYSNDLEKMFTEYASMLNPNQKPLEESPDIIPANYHDIGNYVAKYGLANFQIQAVMEFNGRLDYSKLVKAVRLSVDAEPVLGCRFVKSDPPYWKRFDDIDNPDKFCSMEEVEDSEEGIKRFLRSPMNMDKDPMLSVRVVRSGNYDTLCLKINHVCSDAAGTRDYIHLLADIYSHIDSGDTDYRPIPSSRDRRDLKELKTALGEDTPDNSWGVHQQIPCPTFAFPWKNGRIGTTDFCVCRLPYGQLDIMKRYGKARGATINDLILTAVFRAMFEISTPPYGIPMDIPVTIDLRRHLSNKKADAIRNFSGGIVIRVDRQPEESFEGTLSRVITHTAEMRKKHPSIFNIRWGEYIEKLSFNQLCAYYKGMSQSVELASQSPFYFLNTCSPVLSNFGFISRSLINFGESSVIDAYIIPPAVRAPGILLVASTYNNILSVGVGFYETSVSKSAMDYLLNKICDQLVEGCRE